MTRMGLSSKENSLPYSTLFLEEETKQPTRLQLSGSYWYCSNSNIKEGQRMCIKFSFYLGHGTECSQGTSCEVLLIY